MIKFIIVIAPKCFSNYMAQSNYWAIQTKLLTFLFKNSIETKEHRKFVETQKWILMMATMMTMMMNCFVA